MLKSLVSTKFGQALAGVLGLALLLTVSARAEVKPAPMSLTAYADKKGEVHHFSLIGSTSGSVWGSDLYTLDSSLAAAAVHAGVLAAGEAGVVQVTILAGQPSYKGSAKNGVTSGDWGAYGTSFRVEKSAEKATGGSALPDPGNLAAYDDSKGEMMQFKVTGSTKGSLWGTKMYTLDSHLGTAAVHAGVLKDGEEGVVKVTILAGQPSYKGSAVNGVTSGDWGAYGASYTVEKGSADEAVASSAAKDPGSLTAFASKLGETLVFEVTGATGGSLWGTDLYTLDSQLATAAVHSGLLAAGEAGKVKVTILKGQPSYTGSTKNGVTSGNWGAYEGSYRVEKAE